MQLYNIDYISWHTGHDGIAECDFFFDNLAECDLSDTSMSKRFWHHGGRGGRWGHMSGLLSKYPLGTSVLKVVCLPNMVKKKKYSL